LRVGTVLPGVSQTGVSLPVDAATFLSLPSVLAPSAEIVSSRNIAVSENAAVASPISAPAAEMGKQITARTAAVGKLLERTGPLSKAGSAQAHGAGTRLQAILTGEKTGGREALSAVTAGRTSFSRPSLLHTAPNSEQPRFEPESPKPEPAKPSAAVRWRPLVILAISGAAVVFLSPLTALAVSGVLIILITTDRRTLKKSRQYDLAKKFAAYGVGAALAATLAIYLGAGELGLFGLGHGTDLIYAGAAGQPLSAAALYWALARFKMHRIPG
jgi:hypothetical protein